jgi:Tetracyclin repressor-like, C-terminal domain
MFSKMTKYQQVKSLRERRYWEVAGFRPYLSRPSRLIFDSSVCRGIPSFAAAPEGPEIRPWLSARAASMISTSRSASAEGCMGLNAIRFGQRDAEVTRITRNASRLQRQALMRVLTRAKKHGELSSAADLDCMADFFESTLVGIKMAAKAGKSRRALRNIAAFAGGAFARSVRPIARQRRLPTGTHQPRHSGRPIHG